ncbi:type VI secretion system baseplate subunit TssF [Xenorhabdus bovienii]|uniref:type VI secretion system baseplate subunit TssF n=1 Tax=Xenorhabdus bovienii TaxID=40576 RepID=UPI0023B30A8E|nr:type VI secretion system baseplate subunit TssF [Xenorhabdus bovienii]MDE9487535.1 type VI secretion system baseplate subunit TssF [Xenorhabdus bovienii]
MKKFEHYFQNEIEYIRALQRLMRQEKPHLANILNEQDPDIERLNEGFAFLTARHSQKINDAFPEYTLPPLQRLQSQAIKGIPATSVVQLDSGINSSYAHSVLAGSKISSKTGSTFITSRQCDIEPLALIRREISYSAQETHITLTFEYTGKDDYWDIKPVSLFLSPDETVADTLMFSLRQHCHDIVFYQENYPYPMNGIGLEPLSGASRLILSPPQSEGNCAPQMLMESLYLPHVHHFLTLTLPTNMQHRLSMKTARQFTITLKLSCEMDLSEAQVADAFYPHCVPVVNKQPMQLTVPFAPETDRYRLPLSPENGVLDLLGVELEQEPDEEKERGNEYRFYPDRLQTGMDRYPDDKYAWFYSLEVSEDALGRLQYELVFRDSQFQLMTQPPARKFICHFITFNFQAVPLAAGDRCYADEAIPDEFQIRNLTTVSSPYPPVTDNHRYWELLSHYSASPFLLYSADALKQLLRGYDFYADSDRNVSRTLRRMIDGIMAMNSVPKDWLIKGVPHRCLFVELVLDETAYTSTGEMFRFANTLFQFLPFCLTQDMRMLMTCRTTSGESYVLSRYPVQGYRPLM